MLSAIVVDDSEDWGSFGEDSSWDWFSSVLTSSSLFSILVLSFLEHSSTSRINDQVIDKLLPINLHVQLLVL